MALCDRSWALYGDCGVGIGQLVMFLDFQILNNVWIYKGVCGLVINYGESFN